MCFTIVIDFAFRRLLPSLSPEWPAEAGIRQHVVILAPTYLYMQPWASRSVRLSIVYLHCRSQPALTTTWVSSFQRKRSAGNHGCLPSPTVAFRPHLQHRELRRLRLWLHLCVHWLQLLLYTYILAIPSVLGLVGTVQWIWDRVDASSLQQTRYIPRRIPQHVHTYLLQHSLSH